MRLLGSLLCAAVLGIACVEAPEPWEALDTTQSDTTTEVSERRGEPPYHSWSASFGGTALDAGYGIATDAKGNVLVIGGTNSESIDLGGGPLTGEGGLDIVLGKFAADGKLIWARRIGGAGDDMGYSVATGSGGEIYICGDFTSESVDFGGKSVQTSGGLDAFVAKFDSDGKLAWVVSFGGGGTDTASRVAANMQGGVYVAGLYFSTDLVVGETTLTNLGNASGFLVKLSPSGQTQWAKSFTSSGEDTCDGIAEDNDANVYVAGHFGAADFDPGAGNLEWAGDRDVYLASYNGTGGLNWALGFGGLGWDGAFALDVADNGSVWIAGVYASTNLDFGDGALALHGDGDIFVASFHKSGDHLWSKGFGGLAMDYVSGLVLDDSNNAYLVGEFDSATLAFGEHVATNSSVKNVYMAKLDKAGAPVWARSFGGTQADMGRYLAIGKDGAIHIAGEFQSAEIDFGGGPVKNAGDIDIFLATFED